MPFSGCDRCGIADNDNQLDARTIEGRRVRLCPECGRPMRRVTVKEAIELVRERAEAERWRAAARNGDGVDPAPAARVPGAGAAATGAAPDEGLRRCDAG